MGDRKLLTGTPGVFQADLKSYNHYYPFGWLQPGRQYNSSSYRFGFQNQEMDNEIKGVGNHINFAYRGHDPRTGRFWSVDPLTGKYPFYSPYAFSGNKVISYVEFEGLEETRPSNNTSNSPKIGISTRIGWKELGGFMRFLGKEPHLETLMLEELSKALQRLGVNTLRTVEYG